MGIAHTAGVRVPPGRGSRYFAARTLYDGVHSVHRNGTLGWRAGAFVLIGQAGLTKG